MINRNTCVANPTTSSAGRRAAARRKADVRIRRGSLLIEVVISAALFATAAIAIGRLAKSTAVLSGRADQRLTAQLTAENTLNQLQQIEAEQIADAAAEIERFRSKSSGMKVEIATSPFQLGNRSATHVTVRVSPDGGNDQNGTNFAITIHDWRVDSQASPPSSSNPSRPDDIPPDDSAPDDTASGDSDA